MTKERSKAFQRIARHIVTANSLNELQHWDVVRIETDLSASESADLSKLISENVRRVCESFFGREVV